MKLNIYHRTEYHYDKPVNYSIHVLRLSPKEEPGQIIYEWKIYAPSSLNTSIDAFDNQTHSYVMDGLYTDMIIEAEGEIESTSAHVFTDKKDAVSPYYLLQQTELTLPTKEMLLYFNQLMPSLNTYIDLLKLAEIIQKKINYQSGYTNSNTPGFKAFEISRGVCQDHAHVMLGICRSRQIPARYVSGYFFTPHAKNLASHAWVDVCLDIKNGIWNSIDVTNACVTDDRHVRLAIGRDYSSAAPIIGSRSGGGSEQMNAVVSISESQTI